jgi:vacuolar-type H+-ATPase subunit C/Vma6
MGSEMPVLEFSRHEGYPADYLVARLGGRRSLMIENWDAFVMAEKPVLPARYAEHARGRPGEAIDRALKHELRWVARQMDNGLRKIFHPVFIYFELGALFSCIRYKARRDTTEAVQSALAHSLLSRALRSAVLEAASQAAALSSVEDAFASRSKIYRGITRAGKPADVEQRLTDTFLKDSAARAAHPVIRGFFRTVIDMRNMVSAYKRLRWGIEAAPPIIEGGSAGAPRLRGIATEAALLSAVRRLTGLKAERPSEVENLFLRRLLVYSKNVSRSAGAVGFVLDYLLRCHREALNLRLIFTGGALDRELLRGELA